MNNFFRRVPGSVETDFATTQHANGGTTSEKGRNSVNARPPTPNWGIALFAVWLRWFFGEFPGRAGFFVEIGFVETPLRFSEIKGN